MPGHVLGDMRATANRARTRHGSRPCLHQYSAFPLHFLTLCPNESGRFLDPPAGATAGLSPSRRSPAVPKRYVPVCPTVPLVSLLPLVLLLPLVSGGQRPSAVASASPRCKMTAA